MDGDDDIDDDDENENENDDDDENENENDDDDVHRAPSPRSGIGEACWGRALAIVVSSPAHGVAGTIERAGVIPARCDG